MTRPASTEGRSESDGRSSAERRSGVGIEALELFVEVLSQSDQGATAGDGFYDRL